jgi:hypothetical protein
MRTLVLSLLLAILMAGCSRPVTRLDKLSRVEAAVLTDANGMGPGARGGAAPPIQVTDPDRLAALESFLTARQSRWKKADGMPRPTRFQLQLIAGDRPLYTIWLEPGYAVMATGKTIHETRLSNTETAELMACLGLPPNYMGPIDMMSSPPAVPYAPPAMPHAAVVPAAGQGGEADRPGAVRL